MNIYGDKNNTEKITTAKRKKMMMAATMIRQLVQFLPALRGWLPLPTSWALYRALQVYKCTWSVHSGLFQPAGQGDHCALQVQCTRALQIALYTPCTMERKVASVEMDVQCGVRACRQLSMSASSASSVTLPDSSAWEPQDAPRVSLCPFSHLLIPPPVLFSFKNIVETKKDKNKNWLLTVWEPQHAPPAPSPVVVSSF